MKEKIKEGSPAGQINLFVSSCFTVMTLPPCQPARPDLKPSGDENRMTSTGFAPSPR